MRSVATFTATDPEDAGDIAWTLTGDDESDFEISDSGVLTFAESPNYEMSTGGGETGTSAIYAVTVVATDADNIATEHMVQVEVTNEEEAGTVTLDKVAPYPGILLTASLSDPDENERAHEWQWSKSSSQSGRYTDIEGAEAATYLPTSSDVNYYLRVTVNYNDAQDDGKEAMATSAHRVQSINSPDADPEFQDDNGDMVTTAGRDLAENTEAGGNVGAPVVATDADGDILTYTLGGTHASSFEIDQATGQITVGADTEVDFETTPEYTVTVTAADPGADGSRGSETVTVTITVTDDENEPPAITGTVPASFDEGTDASPLSGAALRVVGFTADDPDPDTVSTITWALSGPDAADFTITDGDLTFVASPNFESPADADGDNTYEVTVSASDSSSNRGVMEVEVKVANVDEPGTVTLDRVQPRVGIPVTASLTDIDGAVSGVTWQWSIDGATGTDSPTQNGEIDGAESNTYTPKAADVGGTLTATASYTDPQDEMKEADAASSMPVAADTRNRAPEFDDQDIDTEGTQNSEAEREIAENSMADAQVGGPVTATDPNAAEVNDVVSYRLGGADASSFRIGLSDGQITVASGTKLDYETKDTYMVTVIATDSFGASSSIPVTITVTGENEGPEISGDNSIEYPEGEMRSVATFTATDPEDAGDIAWTLTGDDESDFEISDSGVLTFAESPNYEMSTGGGETGTSAIYAVTVVATDADNIATEHMVQVEVTNEEEAGTVTLDKVAPYPGILLTASLSDPDENERAHEWQWSKSSSQSGRYTDIEGAEAATYLPTSSDVNYYLRVTVNYNDAQDDGKEAMATSAHRVQSINSPDADPEFQDDNGDMVTTAGRDLAENTEAGGNVGAPVVATDADGDILTYTLGGTHASSFEIDQATGQITVGADTEVDFETTPEYTVTVTAADPGADGSRGSETVTVTITVTDDENEPPAITGTVPASFDEGTDASPLSGAALRVVGFTADDPDPDTVSTITWALSGPDAADFTITDGDLTFVASPNFESPADADGDNTYEVTVSASDSSSNRGVMEVEVKVANVDEPGTVTLDRVQPRVGIPVTASLTDIDGAVSGVTWQWSIDGATGTDSPTQNGEIDGAESNTYTPKAADVGGTLTATASYTDPQDEMKEADAASSMPVAADTRNRAPEFDDQDIDTEGTQNSEAEREIAENSMADAQVGGPVTATDPNAAEVNDVVSYRLGGADASSFRIGLSDGQITVASGTKLDYETKDTYMVTVIATDSFGASSSIPVTITVTGENEGPEIRRVASGNQPPVFPSDTATRSVVEGTAAGADIGAPVTAEDPDVGDALTYTLGGTDAASFNIGRTTGQLQTKAALDHSTKTSYEVTVTAADAAGLSDAITVTINVTDVDENLPPEFPSAVTTRVVAENTVAGEDIGAPVAATDADDAALTYTLSGTDAASFDIDRATGQLKTKAGLDYETKDSYAVTVTATDGDNASDSIDVAITVTDVDEAGTGDTLVDRYDANDNGMIEKSEVLKAINDYLFGEGDEAISKPEVLRLINMYLFG